MSVSLSDWEVKFAHLLVGSLLSVWCLITNLLLIIVVRRSGAVSKPVYVVMSSAAVVDVLYSLVLPADQLTNLYYGDMTVETIDNTTPDKSATLPATQDNNDEDEDDDGDDDDDADVMNNELMTTSETLRTFAAGMPGDTLQGSDPDLTRNAVGAAAAAGTGTAMPSSSNVSVVVVGGGEDSIQLADDGGDRGNEALAAAKMAEYASHTTAAAANVFDEIDLVWQVALVCGVFILVWAADTILGELYYRGYGADRLHQAPIYMVWVWQLYIGIKPLIYMMGNDRLQQHL